MVESEKSNRKTVKKGVSEENKKFMENRFPN